MVDPVGGQLARDLPEAARDVQEGVLRAGRLQPRNGGLEGWASRLLQVGEGPSAEAGELAYGPGFIALRWGRKHQPMMTLLHEEMGINPHNFI